MNNEERRIWIENDESIYNWKRRTHLPMRNFIKEYRKELDEYIAQQLNK